MYNLVYHLFFLFNSSQGKRGKGMKIQVDFNGNKYQCEGNTSTIGQILGYDPDGEIVRQIWELLLQGKTVELSKQTGGKTYKLRPISSPEGDQDTVKL